MKIGCESKEKTAKRSVSLPVLPNSNVSETGVRRSKMSRWRAVSLTVLTAAMIAHYIQWRATGSTVSPIEPSETMFTLQNGFVNAGFIFFSLAILATLILGRFVCGWGCHIVALQDFCAWLLNKFGLKPRPFRSRLLVFVPLIAALYMFVWPTALRMLAAPKGQPIVPQFTNHLVTTEFWATFPTFAVAVPFLFICGFMTVYFLGSKGFCTYACPYGGVFVLADKLAPMRIRVTDDCNQCGNCTATCMANVNVAAEVNKYGMVIDPGCMKHMDCISVCPNDALYLGFGKPAVAVSKDKGTKTAYALTWPEEIFAGLVFLASYLAVWNVYQLVPMLMALGIGTVTTYLAVRSLKLFRTKDLSFYRFNLKSSGKIYVAGWMFLAFATLWIGLNAHSGWVRYNEREGTRGYESIALPDELALAQADPTKWLSTADEQNIGAGKQHFYKAFNGGLFVNDAMLPKLAWLEFLSGNSDQAIKLLAQAADRQQGHDKAISLYYRGAILNRLNRYNDGLASLDKAIKESPDLVTAHEEHGVSLWQIGRRRDAVKEWADAVDANQNLALANYMLAGAAQTLNDAEEMEAYEKDAEKNTPNDPYFHWMIGLRLQNVGMAALAERQFQLAIQLDPKFGELRNTMQ